MNPQTYTQMLALQQQNGSPMTSAPPQAQQAPAPAVPKYNSGNPLKEGATSAIDAIRKSIGGKGGILNSLAGFAQNLGIANLRSSRTMAGQSMGHSLRTTDEQEAIQAAKDAEMMKFLQANEKIKQHQANQIAMQNHRNAQMDHRNAQLQEQRRHHNMMENRPRGGGRSGAESSGDFGPIPEGAVRYSDMTKADQSAMTKSLLQRMSRPNEDRKVLKKLDRVNEIVHKHPHLATSIAIALVPHNYEGGMWDTLRIKANDAIGGKKDRALLEEVEKIRGDLVLNKVHGLAGQRANMFLEKQMSKSNPHAGLTKEAAKAIRDNFKKFEHDENLLESKRARKAYSGRYGIPERELEEYEEPVISGMSGAQGTSGSPVSGLSDEEIENRLRAKGFDVK